MLHLMTWGRDCGQVWTGLSGPMRQFGVLDFTRLANGLKKKKKKETKVALSFKTLPNFFRISSEISNTVGKCFRWQSSIRWSSWLQISVLWARPTGVRTVHQRVQCHNVFCFAYGSHSSVITSTTCQLSTISISAWLANNRPHSLGDMADVL